MFRAKSTTANMLWKPCQRGMLYSCSTTCGSPTSSDSVMASSAFQVLFVSKLTPKQDLSE